MYAMKMKTNYKIREIKRDTGECTRERERQERGYGNTEKKVQCVNGNFFRTHKRVILSVQDHTCYHQANLHGTSFFFFV